MANDKKKRVDELQDDALFSPEHKSPERRVGSAIAAAITLPALLGIVDSRTGFIGSGSWQSYKQHYGKILGDLFNAAENHPFLKSQSGSRPIQVQVNALREKILDDIDKKGSSAWDKTPDIPNFVKDAEVMAAEREAAFRPMGMDNPASFQQPTIKQKLNIRPHSAESAYQWITGHELGNTNKKIHINSTVSESDLFKEFSDAFNDFSGVVSPSDGNKSVTANMAAMEAQHRSLLNMIGLGSLHDQTYSTSAYAKELAKGMKLYEKQIGDLKQRVNQLESIMNTSSNPKTKATAKAQLEILAKGSNLSVDHYIDTIKNMKVRVEVTNIVRGEIPFPKAEIIIDMGKHKQAVRQSFNIERFGMFLPHEGANIHNSALLLGAGGTSKDAVTVTLAQMQDAFTAVERTLNDLQDAGLEGYQVDRQSSRRRTNYMEHVGPQTGHLQDVVRGFKIINENFRHLAGEESPFFYKMHAVAKQGFFTDSIAYGTDTPTIAFDLEFNAPKSGTKGSQMMVRDARTRVFWMNYVVKKGGSDEKIFNHFILPETWDDVSSAAREFVARHQGAEGFEQFESLTKSFEKAKKDIVAGERYSTVSTNTWGKQKIWSEWGSVVEMAKNIYKSHDGTVAWLGHNISNADLPVLNATVTRVLENDLDKLSKHEINLLKRLRIDTSAQSLAAKGLVMDTYAMARAAFMDVERTQSFKLVDIFETAIQQAVNDVNPSNKIYNNQNWTHGLAKAVKNSRGRINQEVKTYLKDLPTDIKNSLRNWITQNPDDVISTFGAQGHHSAGFDTRKAILLHDLTRWKMEKLKTSNPELYNSIIQTGDAAEAIVNGRRFGWNRNINLVDQASLYDIPDHGIGEDQRSRIYSHLFAFTPTAASRGIGGAFGPENYLPFGQYTNLQKQMYQTASAKTLLPNIDKREARVSKGLFPVVQRSIDQSHESSLWTTSIGSAMNKIQATREQAISKLQKPIDNRFRMMALYLPANNELLAQDTALFANRHSMALASHFPNGTDGLKRTQFSKRAQQIIWALAERKAGGAKAKDAHTFLDNLFGGQVKDPTVRQFLEHSGIPEEILNMVDKEKITLKTGNKTSLSNALLSDVMEMQGTGEVKIKFETSIQKRMDILSGKTKQNVLDPDATFLQVWDDAANNGQGGWKKSAYDINNPLKYAAILDQLTFNVDKGTFIYDAVPFDTPAFAKIVDSNKLLKGNVHGVANNFRLGKGIGLVLTSKKPNLAQVIDTHMRRSLTNIHMKDLPVAEQRRRIKSMLMDSFDVTDAEFESYFKLTESKAIPGQGFKNAIVQVQLVDNYKLGLEGKNVWSRVSKMLERSGVTHDELRKRFISMNQDAIKDLKIKGDVKHQLGKIYDQAVIKQNKFILGLETNVDVKNPNQIKTINEMKKIVRKTNVALFDVGFMPDISEVDLSELQSTGLIDDSGKLSKGINVSPFANLLVQEFVQAEDFMDIKDPLKRSVDQAGIPLNKTYSIWQTMIIYNNSRNNPTFTDNFMKHAMSISGRFDSNIKKMMHAHWDAAAALQDGFKFDSGAFKTLSVEEMYNDVAIMSKLEISKMNLEGKTAEQIEQILLARGVDPTRAEDIARSLQDDVSMSLERVGISGGMLDEDAVRQMKVFERTHGKDLTKFKLFSETNEEMIKKLANSQGASGKDLLGLIDSLKLKTRAMLSGEIRKHLRERASGNIAEKELLEFAFQRFPGSFNETMDSIVMPTLDSSAPVYMAEQGRYMVVKESAALTQMETIITEFNDELNRTVGDGMTPANMRKVKDLHQNMMARLAPEVITGIYGGISSAAWKMNQLYGRGHQYAKAVDSVLLGKNVLGGLLGQMKLGDKTAPKGFGTWGNYLDTTVSSLGPDTDPVIKALNDLKSKLGKNTLDATIAERAAALNLTEEKFLATKQGASLANLRKTLKRARNRIGTLVGVTESITIGQVLRGITTGGNDKIGNLAQGGYLSASGLGVGENFMTSSQLAYSIASGDPYQLAKEMTADGYSQHWERLLTGRSPLRDMLSRSPMFENTLGFNLSGSYVWHDQLFLQAGYKQSELTKFVTMNGLELMLMRGDYDGDLVQRYLLSLGKVKTKEEAAMYVNERRRIVEKLRIRGMEKGYDANIFRGLDYNIIKDIDPDSLLSGHEWDHPRALIKQITGDDVENLLRNQIEDIVDESSMNYAEDTTKKRGLTYMVQQLLTGQIGEQEKRWDLKYGGASGHEGIKTSVIDHLADALGDAKKDDRQLAALLNELGYDTRNTSNIKGLARKAVTEAQDAWNILNSKSDFKTFSVADKTWHQTQGLRKLDLVTEWMQLFTHEVPIEKGKTAGGLSQIMSTVNTKYRFHRGALGINSQTGFQVAQEIYEGLGVTAAQANNLYINPDSDIFNSPDLLAEAQTQKNLIKNEFHVSVQAVMHLEHLNRVMIGSGMKAGDLSSFMASRKPKSTLFGALMAELGTGDAWVGSELTNLFSSSERQGISTGTSFANMATHAIDNALDANKITKRSGVETLGKFVKGMSEGAAHTRWTRRAAIGMMAFAIMDPNTNSLLLPDQRGGGEEFDIPSLRELSRGYRREKMKLRGGSPILADKLLAEAGMPIRFGTPGRINRYVPPAPANYIRSRQSRRKDNPADLHELTRQLGGIIRQ